MRKATSGSEIRYTASPVTCTPTFSCVTWSAVNWSRWMLVGTMATESPGSLKQLAPWPLTSRTRPRRMWTRNSLGRAVTSPQRFIFSGSSAGLPARHPST